jgi:uncharacterized protein YdaU (DUF1376 family)
MSEFHKLRLTRFDFDAADFLESEDVATMTCSEVGQYVLLLLHAWLGGKDATLPADPKALARFARAPRGVSPKVLRKFQATHGGRLHNSRLTAEWDAACVRAGRRQEKAQKAGKASAFARAQGQLQVNLEPSASRPQVEPGPNLNQPPSPSPIPSPKEAAHIDQAKIQGAAPSLTVEKEERLSINGREKSQEKTVPTWCRTPLHEELYTGVYRKDVEKRFFDCRNLSFEEQLAECVQAAVTPLALNRTRRFIEAQLHPREVERAAIARLQTAKQVLPHVADYGTRCSQTVAAVCRAVVEAAAEIIELRCATRRAESIPGIAGAERGGENV